MIKTVIQQSNRLLQQNQPKPEVSGTQVLVKVNTISLCGSDLHLFHGTYNGPKNYPIMFGHEWSGTVVEVGGDVQKLSIGDMVTGDCSLYCGTCRNCQRDRNMCTTIEKYGITVDGASAEYIIRDEMHLYPYAKEIGFNLGALVEPLAVSRNLIKKIVAIDPEIYTRRILVIGLGGIGLGAFLQLKHVYGCQDVAVMDVSVKRKEIARRLGAKVVDSSILDPEEDTSKYGSMYSDEGYDLILDTTGNAFVFSNMFKLIAPFGILGCLGMLGSVTIPQKLIVLKGLTLLGSIGGTGSFEDVLRFLEDYPEEASELISHKFSIERLVDTEQAFLTAGDIEASIKVQLEYKDK